MTSTLRCPTLPKADWDEPSANTDGNLHKLAKLVKNQVMMSILPIFTRHVKRYFHAQGTIRSVQEALDTNRYEQNVNSGDIQSACAVIWRSVG
jgi:hypothetical protein